MAASRQAANVTHLPGIARTSGRMPDGRATPEHREIEILRRR